MSVVVAKSNNKTMRVDMHVHSIYSERPVDGLLKYIGCMESYTDPESIYQQCKARGMDAVTITDHNRIDGVMELLERYPEDVFTGVEATTYFPEDGCKIHLLIYGFSEEQFREINKLRKNIYELSAYLRRENLLHGVAHANSVVDDSNLTKGHIEKLLVLFDHFEVVNGSYTVTRNRSLQTLMAQIKSDPDFFYQLAAKHNLEPMVGSSWIKGMFGGSDDHAGLYAGKTYTKVKVEDGQDILLAVQNKETSAHGWQCLGHWWATTIALVGVQFFFTQITSPRFILSLSPII